jgi:hypothetical protein
MEIVDEGGERRLVPRLQAGDHVLWRIPGSIAHAKLLPVASPRTPDEPSRADRFPGSGTPPGDRV